MIFPTHSLSRILTRFTTEAQFRFGSTAIDFKNRGWE